MRGCLGRNGGGTSEKAGAGWRHVRGVSVRTDFRQNRSPPGQLRSLRVCLSLQGDALLALWKVERRQLENIITVVIKCSLEIHGLFETQEAEEGLDVRVKIGEARERRVAPAFWERVPTPRHLSLSGNPECCGAQGLSPPVASWTLELG